MRTRTLTTAVAATLTAAATASLLASTATSAHAGLPRTIGPGQAVMVDGVRLAITGRATDGAVATGDTRLVVADDTTRVRAPIPAGQSPRLYTRIASFGSGGPGYVVSQSGGDAAGWTVFVIDGRGRLVAAQEPRRPFLGNAAGVDLAGQYAEQRTRIAARGLTTVITAPDSGDRVVYRWRLVSRDGVPTLVARRR